MKLRQVLIFLSSLFLLVNIGLAKELAQDSTKLKSEFKKSIERKVASTFELKKANGVYTEFLKCKEIEKTDEYMKKTYDCMNKFFSKHLSEGQKIKLVLFTLSNENFSTLKKCDVEVLERNPSVLEEDNDFVLCAGFEKGQRRKNKTAIFLFDQRGDKLEIVDIKD